jgi:hypothetical protein
MQFSFAMQVTNKLIFGERICILHVSEADSRQREREIETEAEMGS